MSVAQRDSGRAALAERLARVELAVVVGVAEGDDAAARATASGFGAREHVAIGRHDQMAGATDIGGDDRRAETLRQGDAAVIGIAGGRGGAAKRNGGEQDGNQRRNSDEPLHFVDLLGRSATKTRRREAFYVQVDLRAFVPSWQFKNAASYCCCALVDVRAGFRYLSYQAR